MTAALTLDGLQFNYGPEQPLLQDLTLHIQPGEKVGLIGPNGAGKTSLFLLIAGVLAPQAGKICIYGQGVKRGQFLPDVGLVFQNPDDQLFCPTVWDELAFGAENLGLSPSEVRQRVERALAVTGVESLAQRAPHQLSGGEKCMVAIASVLVLQPRLMLYDEPTAHLDLAARRSLIEFFHRAPETLLISSHDLEMIVEVCDRTLLLNHHRILADGPTAEILRDQSLLTANRLEVPPSLQG
ncbi:MAG: ABC transporter ATP-binding protein [Spirulina sp. DLM2.Bin59]|nr:MAG: ABC transporter ATP-binding protein [Spirulina sp. DLM2.Bin59]